MSRILKCSNCLNEFGNEARIPKVLNCGNSVCSQCTTEYINKKCKFCNQKHSGPFPTNNSILGLFVEDTAEQINPANSIKQRLRILEQNKNNCIQLIDENYSFIEHDINNRYEKIVEELSSHRNQLLNQLKEYKNFEKSQLDDIPDFKVTKTTDMVNLATAIKDELLKVNSLMSKVSRPEVKFIKSNLKIDQNSFLGRLEKNVENRLRESSVNIGFKKQKYFKYELPFDCKNIIFGFLPNSNLLKVTESSIMDNFQYSLNIELIIDNKISRKTNEIIGAYRVKKLITNNYTNFFLVLITNKYQNSNDFLKLYDDKLELIKTKNLSFTPKEVYMSEKHIYLKKSAGILEKCDLNFSPSAEFQFQNTDRNSDYYVPKSYILIQIQNDRLIFLDSEKSKIRIVSEPTGKLIKSFDIDYQKDLCLIRVDSNDYIYILNKRVKKLIIYNIDGIMLSQKKIDTKRMNDIDNFHPYSDQTFSILDLKSCIIDFF